MAERSRSRSPKPASQRTGKKPAKQPRSRARRWITRILLSGLIIVLVGGLVGAGGMVYAYQRTTIPDPNADFTTNTSFLYWGDGKTRMASLAIQNRQSIDYDAMPQSIKDAVVAAENRTFWTDPGISVPGMVRAAWKIATGGDVQGGSTITQQYIKIYYLTSDQTVTRKFKELLLAVKLGREVPKEKILESYLNTIYFGRGAYGIQAASRAYFNVDASKLSVAQSAVLASVINNSSIYDPSVAKGNKERLLERYRYVLDGMLEGGTISQADHDKAYKKLPSFPDIPVSNRYAGPNGFLVRMVQDELAAKGFSETEINGGGLRVTTTFDRDAQSAAVEAAQSNTKKAAEAAGAKASGLHAAISSVDVQSGEVLALYGGADYIKNSRNWATTARPTGSTFKTFALAAGLEDGFSLRSVFKGNTFTPAGTNTPIRNEFSYQYGPVQLLKATALSINTAFVDMTTQMEDGAKKIAQAAVAAGAPNKGWDTATDRMALGISEVSPLNMASAYATYANDGVRVSPHVVREVTDADGKVLYKADTKGERAVDTDIARDVTYALSDVVEQGTGSRVSTLGRPVAGKTGTNGLEPTAKDPDGSVTSAWFVAFTPQISTAVMYVAGDGGNGDLDDYRRPGDGTFFGGTYPAQTWADYMSPVVEGMDVEQFKPAAWVNVDTQRGRPSIAPRPTQTARPTETQSPSQKPTETATEKPSETSRPSETATEQPSETMRPSETTRPSATATERPTQSSRPTATSRPTASSSGGGGNGGNGNDSENGGSGDQGN